jgi:predicted TPR repeat methyltransferase
LIDNFRVEIDSSVPAVQGDEFFVVHLDGERRTVNIHDYAGIYAVPGLYEHVLQLRLQSKSPQMMAASLGARVALSKDAATPVRCLDVGAGVGLSGAALSVEGLAPTVGMDIIPAAAEAAQRDRPGLYERYVVGDLGKVDLAPLIKTYRLNALVSSAALTGGHIEPQVLAKTWAAFSPGDWLAFTCLDSRADTARAGFDNWTDFEFDEPFLHRRLTTGEPVHFRSLVGRRRHTARTA